jgi:hypothetical protein
MEIKLLWGTRFKFATCATDMYSALPILQKQGALELLSAQVK